MNVSDLATLVGGTARGLSLKQCHIKHFAKDLADVCVQYKIAVAASSTSEELHWLELLAKKLRGYLIYHGKQKQQFKAPTRFTTGGASRDAIVFPLQDVLGRTRNTEEALIRLGVLDSQGNQLSSTRAVSVLTWLVKTRIVLLERESNGGVAITDNGIQHAPASMYFDSNSNCIGVPVLSNMHIDTALVPNIHTFVHELEHARDFYTTGFREGIGVLREELTDFTGGGPTYYLDLPEVKARCKELALAIKEILADTYARLVDATELAHTNNSVSRMSYVRMANKLSTAIRQLLRTPDTFSEWALSGRGSESIPMLLMPNIGKFIKFIGAAQASKKNAFLRTILGENRSDIRAAKALQYVEDFLVSLYKDLKARYKPVIKGL